MAEHARPTNARPRELIAVRLVTDRWLLTVDASRARYATVVLAHCCLRVCRSRFVRVVLIRIFDSRQSRVVSPGFRLSHR